MADAARRSERFLQHEGLGGVIGRPVLYHRTRRCRKWSRKREDVCVNYHHSFFAPAQCTVRTKRAKRVDCLVGEKLRAKTLILVFGRCRLVRQRHRESRHSRRNCLARHAKICHSWPTIQEIDALPRRLE